MPLFGLRLGILRYYYLIGCFKSSDLENLTANDQPCTSRYLGITQVFVKLVNERMDQCAESF